MLVTLAGRLQSSSIRSVYLEIAGLQAWNLWIPAPDRAGGRLCAGMTGGGGNDGPGEDSTEWQDFAIVLVTLVMNIA